MIEVNNLVRYFGDIRAVNQVSLSVEKGDILGFIGPNGAGKSTTIRMITGYLSPSSGEVKICGKSMADNEMFCKSQIGYLPETAPLYHDMSVKSFLAFTAELRGIDGGDRKTAVDAVIQKCFLERVAYQNIGTLSKGYRQRTCFAQSVLHDPPILILDEPTDGMDPNQKFEIRKIIEGFGKEKAVMISTHILEEVEALCTRVVVMRRGEVVANESVSDFKSRGDKLADNFRDLTLPNGGADW
ncbi:ABC-type multidrug transport system, ATPase component [Lentisphaera araneosa HTCC2155]|uniref:ABC-type multidrug transport system, ATPase component n=1 Tax=Lentisphaera araneosa HTCC2155 TaxID=313628 RepID=A6DQ22_9BACT|nr:ATP-binding cassette domain-containing protein [Lentisphaera araneosa]EDM26263.1 ABC-type multidrug transport system, ATPase component [Lentisphaera araneosa HTCC2155]